MFGFHPVASFPISDIEGTVVGTAKRDAKIKIWTVPSRKTEWTIPVCKLEATLSKRSDTWTVPS